MQLLDDIPQGSPAKDFPGNPGGQPVGNKRRILIVEDEHAFRDILSAELAKEGFDVISAMDGVEGIEKMRQTKPDLVLLDIVMPRKDGFSVIQDAKADETLKSIPIIVLSNSGDMVELSRAKDMGVRDILVKTVFGPQELVARIEHVLSHPADIQPQPGDSEVYRIENDAVAQQGQEQNTQAQPAQSLGHILLVEDDPFLWSLIQSKLLKEGFGVTVAKDGQDALSQVKVVNPVLILLDIILPDMNGFAVLEKLKADDATKNIPVIVLSNLGQQEDIQKGMSLGAKDYLIKAHHAPQEIVDKIKKILAGG